MKNARWIVALAALGAGVACAATHDEKVEGLMGNDRFVVGGSVTHTQPVAGDLIAAGGEVEIVAPVHGDEVVAGGYVRVRGNVGDNVYAAGGRLYLDGTVGRNARVAGGKVQVSDTASIAGNLAVAGGTIAIRGKVAGYVQAAGGEITIDGPVGGDVAISGGRLVLGPHAVIHGDVRYHGDNFVRDPAAVVTGHIDRLGSTAASTAASYGHFSLNGGWIWSAGLLLLAALFAVAVPPASMRVASELRRHPFGALMFGFITLVCIPMAVILLMATVIGIPLALVGLLGYLILVVLGYVATAVAIGDAAVGRLRPLDAQRSSTRVIGAVAAMLVLTLVARVPFVGGIIVFLAVLLGIGAIVMAMRPRPATAAAL